MAHLSGLALASGPPPVNQSAEGRVSNARGPMDQVAFRYVRVRARGLLAHSCDFGKHVDRVRCGRGS